MPLLPTHWVGTDVGIARDLNEDAFLWLGPADTEGRGWLWVVADGLGGAAAGDLAAALLVTTFEDGWAVALEEHRGFAAAVDAVVAATCRRVAGVESTFPSLRGMSAAVAIVAYVDGQLWTAHAGDCRVCRVRAGQLERLTDDHLAPGAAAELAGKQPGALGEVHRLTRVVGAAGVTLDIRGPELALDGDAIVITSDGVHGVLADSAIASMAAASARDAVDQLVAAAREGWSDDNLTAAVVQFGSALASDELPPRTNVATLPGPAPAGAMAPTAAPASNPLANMDATKTLSFSPDLLRQLTAPPSQAAPRLPLAQQAATSTLLFSRADLAALEATSTRTGLLAGRIVEAAQRTVENQSSSAPRSGNAPVVGVRAAVAGVGGDLGAARQRIEPYKPMPRTRRSDDTAPVDLQLDDDDRRSFAPYSSRSVVIASLISAAVMVMAFLFARAGNRKGTEIAAEGSSPSLAADPAGGIGIEGSAASSEGSGNVE